MKKFLLLLAAVALTASMAQADAASGQKVYLKNFKAKFNMNGTKFAAEHTVSEWEDLFANDAKGFVDEYGKRFPNALPVLANPEMKDKIQEVGDFAKQYGSDSGNVPSCG
ncbi:MAG: hypothetical protein PHI47_04500 [Sulfuricurvum sp.]|uniref:hypothetical protein n=1 Tax=Sulfuricurvum sp. TaxID=2025608 RepID=UPI00261CDEE9|nr:hypothetical protein [Sulfuricurvum sp.]MDD5159288.1 hypothetical protein [Sulfuricurvum sp.]